MSKSAGEIAEDLRENGRGLHPIVGFVRPDLHNALRDEVGMEPADHCADCWGVMEDGECRGCGGTDVYERGETPTTDATEGDA